MDKGVFFALRPEKAHPSDHITLRYFDHRNDPAFVYDVGLFYERLLPVGIKDNGYASWKSGDTFYGVMLVDRFHINTPSAMWTYTPTPHRTIIKSDSPVKVPAWVGDEDNDFKAEKLWLGRSKGDGNYDWVEVSKDKKKEIVAWIRNQ